MKVALDTNVLVSAVATRGLCADVVRLVLAEHDLIVGETVLMELRRNLRKKLRLSADVAAEYESFLRRQGVVTAERSNITVASLERADVNVLAEAVGGEADVLVTGDRGLLEVRTKSPIPILSPRQFWEFLRTDAQ